MVDKKIVIETITELIDANVDKESIFSTLRDIGVPEGDIESNYDEIINSKSKRKPTEKKEENTTQPINETITDKPKTNKPNYVKIDDISNLGVSKQEEELKDTALEVNDINNKEGIDDIKQELATTSIDSSESISTHTSDDIKIIEKQISELETKIDGIKAELSGLTKIMKDILEENRNILNKL